MLALRLRFQVTELPIKVPFDGTASKYAGSIYTPAGTTDDREYAWPSKHSSFHDMPPALFNVSEIGESLNMGSSSILNTLVLDIARNSGITVAQRWMQESRGGAELHVSTVSTRSAGSYEAVGMEG